MLILVTLTALVVFTPIFPGLRPALVFAFFLLGPGAGLIGLLDLKDALSQGVLVVALSLALDGAVALGLLYAHAWSYQAGFLFLGSLSLGGAAAAWFHQGKTARSSPPARAPGRGRRRKHAS